MLEPLRLVLRRHSLADHGSLVREDSREQTPGHMGIEYPHYQALQSSARLGHCLGKRVFDMTIALLALIVLGPLLLVIALLIRLDSPGPVIFRQVRIGYQGRPFTLYKFRTMYQGSSEALHRAAIVRYMRGEAIGGTETAQVSHVRFKLNHDPRVTRIGRWLRRFSLDELPQFINVLCGDMTVVGPRPALPYEVELYTPYQWQRFQARPGITGIWQVYGRSRVPFTEMIEMDLTYIRCRSLLLDLKLIWLTIAVVLLQRGAA
jgi:lipopolysaccharide/colanic/teichoic acid biosynthesis glycosyltransferase